MGGKSCEAALDEKPPKEAPLPPRMHSDQIDQRSMHIDFFLQTTRRESAHELAARCSVAHVERTPAATASVPTKACDACSHLHCQQPRIELVDEVAGDRDRPLAEVKSGLKVW